MSDVSGCLHVYFATNWYYMLLISGSLYIYILTARSAINSTSETTDTYTSLHPSPYLHHATVSGCLDFIGENVMLQHHVMSQPLCSVFPSTSPRDWDCRRLWQLVDYTVNWFATYTSNTFTTFVVAPVSWWTRRHYITSTTICAIRAPSNVDVTVQHCQHHVFPTAHIERVQWTVARILTSDVCWQLSISRPSNLKQLSDSDFHIVYIEIQCHSELLLFILDQTYVSTLDSRIVGYHRSNRRHWPCLCYHYHNCTAPSYVTGMPEKRHRVHTLLVPPHTPCFSIDLHAAR